MKLEDMDDHIYSKVAFNCLTAAYLLIIIAIDMMLP